MAKPTVTCVVQARAGSSRLPGKVLMDLGGVPMLEFLLRRLERLEVDALVVATSDRDIDDAVAEVAQHCGVAVVRGSESDVLARFGAALDAHPADHVVRITADCPLTDPGIVHAVLAHHLDTRADYTCNVLPRTFPKGLDVEVARTSAFRVAIAEATRNDEREHVTPFLYRRPGRFRLANVRSGRRLGNERWTVDTADDIEALRAMVAATRNSQAGWTEILRAVGVQEPAPVPGAVTLRPTEATDAGFVLALRNDPEAVRWSGTGTTVDSIDHARWFARALGDPGRRLYIAERDGQAVASARVDVADGIGTVSIAVAPDHRGEGVGDAVLAAISADALADAQVVTLDAAVHRDHGASRRIFERAGYEITSDDGPFLHLVRPVRAPMN